MDDETRKESSVPVQSRISIVDLAKMDWYWLKVEGVHMKSMSQLVSWTFTALCDILESNGKMPENAVKDVLSAHKYLMARGLYQQSLRKRSESRIVAALGFENLRKQGVDPAACGSTMHKVMHSEHSIKVVDRQIDHGGGTVTDEEWDEIGKRIAEEKEKERKQEVREAIEAARKNGRLAEEECVKESNVKVEGLRRMSNKECDEWEKDILERDKKRKTLENAPIDPGDFKIVEE